MNHAPRAALAAVAALFGCGEGPGSPGTGDGGARSIPAPPAAPVGVHLAFDADGSTAPLSISTGSSRGADGVAAIWVAPDRPDSCLQLTELTDGLGLSHLVANDFGPFNRRGDERTAVLVGDGTWVLPTAAAALAGPLRVRVSLRDCATFGRPWPDTPTAAGVRIVPIGASHMPPAANAAALTIPVRFVVTRSVWLGDSPAALRVFASDLETALSIRLAALGVAARIIDTCRLDEPGDAAFQPGDLAPLRALVEHISTSCPNAGATLAVPVVLAGCLEQDDPLGGAHHEPSGFTTHIPGGVGAPMERDAIFVSGRLCSTPSVVPIRWGASSLANVLAHELGHWLGLFHSVEADGTTDLLDDTSDRNAMYFQASDPRAEGFSALQAAVARRHPILRTPL